MRRGCSNIIPDSHATLSPPPSNPGERASEYQMEMETIPSSKWENSARVREKEERDHVAK